MHTISTTIFLAAVLLGAISLGATNTRAQVETQTSVSGGFANVQTVQNDNHIVITVTKAGAEPPDGPVIVPDADAGDNGTIVTPTNNTETGNQTDVIVIEPDGNVTQVPGNVTNIDNSTIVVAPDNQTVTETDGGVVVVDPVPCACPPADEEEPVPVVTEPAAANDTAVAPVEGNETVTEEEEQENDTENPFLGTLGLPS